MAGIKRATYRGVGLFANGMQINRASAFGASGTLTKEDVFEIGNSGIAGIIDDENEVTVTIDATEYGAVDTLATLAGKANSEVVTEIDFSKDFEYSKADIWNYVLENGTDTYATELVPACTLTSYNANYSVDGSATESFSLVGDNKYWFMNGLKGISEKEASEELGTFTIVAGTKAKLLSLWAAQQLIIPQEGKYLKRKFVEPEQYTVSVTGGTITITDVEEGVIEEPDWILVGTVASDVEGAKFAPITDGTSVGKRRGHIDVYLVSGVTKSGTTFITNALQRSARLFKVQSVSVDASLTREEIPQLGDTRVYDRPLQLPMDVTVSFDLVFGELAAFAQFCGESESADELSLENFKSDLGLLVRIRDERDIDTPGAEGVAVKEIHVPYLIPTDEAFNISLDGQATQTFSFRSHELGIKKVS